MPFSEPTVMDLYYKIDARQKKQAVITPTVSEKR